MLPWYRHCLRCSHPRWVDHSPYSNSKILYLETARKNTENLTNLLFNLFYFVIIVLLNYAISFGFITLYRATNSFYMNIIESYLVLFNLKSYAFVHMPDASSGKKTPFLSNNRPWSSNPCVISWPITLPIPP